MGIFTTQEGNKTQLARAFAAFGLGPFLMTSAYQAENAFAGWGLLVGGLTTSIYNTFYLFKVRMDENAGPVSAKSGQKMRLIDVFVLGPFLIWAGYNARDTTIGWLLVAAGIGTMIFNGHNYLVAAS